MGHSTACTWDTVLRVHGTQYCVYMGHMIATRQAVHISQSCWMRLAAVASTPPACTFSDLRGVLLPTASVHAPSLPADHWVLVPRPACMPFTTTNRQQGPGRGGAPGGLGQPAPAAHAAHGLCARRVRPAQGTADQQRQLLGPGTGAWRGTGHGRPLCRRGAAGCGMPQAPRCAAGRTQPATSGSVLTGLVWLVGSFLLATAVPELGDVQGQAASAVRNGVLAPSNRPSPWKLVVPMAGLGLQVGCSPACVGPTRP